MLKFRFLLFSYARVSGVTFRLQIVLLFTMRVVIVSEIEHTRNRFTMTMEKRCENRLLL